MYIYIYTLQQGKRVAEVGTDDVSMRAVPITATRRVACEMSSEVLASLASREKNTPTCAWLGLLKQTWPKLLTRKSHFGHGVLKQAPNNGGRP